MILGLIFIILGIGILYWTLFLLHGSDLFVLALPVFIIGICLLKPHVQYILALKKGKRYYAKIWSTYTDYSDHTSSSRNNTYYALVLNLRFFDDHYRLRQEKVSTFRKTIEFPIGKTIEIAEYNNKIYLVDGKILPIDIAREKELLNPDAKVICLTGYKSNSYTGTWNSSLEHSSANSEMTYGHIQKLARMNLCNDDEAPLK